MSSVFQRCFTGAPPRSVLRISIATPSRIPYRAFSHASLRAAMDKAPSSSDQKSRITDWVKPGDKSGEFKRQASAFRNWIENKPGAEFPPEKGRYHLYVSYACPWAHRTMIVRRLKGLEDFVGMTSVHWHMGEKGAYFPVCETSPAKPGPAANYPRLALRDQGREATGRRCWPGPPPLRLYTPARHLPRSRP